MLIPGENVSSVWETEMACRQRGKLEIERAEVISGEWEWQDQNRFTHAAAQRRNGRKRRVESSL
jgi:hypothetical protein